MFNFLFDGKIGDILAPVVPSNQLFLAIQHHKNDQIPQLLNAAGYDANRLNHGEYSAIHVACRYNNRYALELLLAKGTNPHSIDQQGNTPLHYAAKYGHLELCKYLIESGCQVGIKNKNQQTCYDVAESHIVRQYLLPLVLAADRSSDAGVMPPPPLAMNYQPSYQNQVPATPLSMQQQQPNFSTAQVAPPYTPSQAAQVPLPQQQPQQSRSQFSSVQFPHFSSSNQQLPTVSTAPTTTTTTTVPNMPVYQPNYSYNTIQNVKAPSQPSGTSRTIQPDGFHSSASDPVLQQKYGHIIERPNIAPPPTGPVAFSGYPNSNPAAPYPPQSSNIYNRYVAYDTNQVFQPPQQQGVNYYSQPQYPTQPQYHQQSQVPPLPSPTRQANSAPPSFHTSPPVNVDKPNESILPQHPGAPTAVNRLLANRPIPAEIGLNDSALPVIKTPANPSPIPNDEGEGVIIQAGSNSNAVL